MVMLFGKRYNDNVYEINVKWLIKKHDQYHKICVRKDNGNPANVLAIVRRYFLRLDD